MDVIVDTFINTEVEELIYDEDKLQEWKTKVEEMNLHGQIKLAETEKSPNPFLFMKRSYRNILTTLCPSRVKLDDYDKEPIPLEALGAIALAERENYFHKIEIWYDDVDPDPVAVGIVDDSWNSDKYIIARWSDERTDWETLRKRAAQRFTEEKTNKLQERIANCEADLNKIDVLAEKHMRGRDVYLHD